MRNITWDISGEDERQVRDVVEEERVIVEVTSSTRKMVVNTQEVGVGMIRG